LSEQIFRVNKTKGCEAAVLRPQQAQISKPMLSGHGIITSGQIGLIWVLTCTWPVKISVGAIAFFSAVVTRAGTTRKWRQRLAYTRFGGKAEIKTAR
jgi:hypothetical protein